MKFLEIICNLATLPIKIIIALPVTVIAIIGGIAGYREPMDLLGIVLFERWFNFD